MRAGEAMQVGRQRRRRVRHTAGVTHSGAPALHMALIKYGIAVSREPSHRSHLLQLHE